jgi:nitronate monooxygenase
VKIPIWAAGGFGDGRRLAAALALGAEGINLGTRFCATLEAPTHPNFKDAIVAGDERSTDTVFRSYPNSARTSHNAVSQEILSIEEEGRFFEDLAHLAKGQRPLGGLNNGDIDHGLWKTGLVRGLIYDIPNVGDLVSRIVRDAENMLIERMSAMVTRSSHWLGGATPMYMRPDLYDCMG